MTPPKPPATGRASAVSLPLRVLTARADFLAAARALRAAMPGFILQARNRADDAGPRIGFTCSRKVGNAVSRNRAKRRLREVARLTLTPRARTGWDYVLVGRANSTAAMTFTQLQSDLETALARIHGDP